MLLLKKYVNTVLIIISVKDAAAEKIREYRADYNIRPSNSLL
jgi:hypothetical protein